MRHTGLALALAVSFAVLAACGPDELSPGTGGAGGGATSTTTSGGGGEGGSTQVTPPHDWFECQASDQAFVRKALFALDGRRSWGQAEVNAYEDAIVALTEEGAAPAPVYWDDLAASRALVARSIMNEGAYLERWSDFFMDALRVARTEVKSQESCYGEVLGNAFDDGSLAAWVRDSDATLATPPVPGFGMGDLLRSALVLDDLSVVYRAHLFAMMAKPLTGANVDVLTMERNRRQDYGAIFDDAYLHRDHLCLGCHNSEFSVTYDADPSKNRAWPVPGLFEKALFGASSGSDEARAHAMLRAIDVLEGPLSPYGWTSDCGTFAIPQIDDPLGVDASFGSIHSSAENPQKGLRASVWDLERSLHRGVDKLAAHGLRRLAGGELADADEAFAYLVAENIVEKVWAEVTGTRLTIANYFSRTSTQRDILMTLSEHFVATHFSLKTLLLDILSHPAFNLEAPEKGCGTAAYELPPVFDPWTVSDKDLSKRPNSPADGIFAISSRPLLRSLHRAMEWPASASYPQSADEQAFQEALGVFLKDAEPGFRGLDFQGRLTWESAYGACAKQASPDFIDKIVAASATVPDATLGDGVIALKDRLIGEPWIEPLDEAPAIETLVGAPLSSAQSGNLEAQLRLFCGALVSTPQFMLGGLAPVDTREEPRLAPPEHGYGPSCDRIANDIASLGAPYLLTCGNGSMTATKL